MASSISLRIARVFATATQPGRSGTFSPKTGFALFDHDGIFHQNDSISNYLEKSFELFDRQTSVASNTTHGESVDRIVAWNRYYANTVRHHDVFTLAHYSKAGLLQSANRVEVIDAGNLRHITPPPLPHGHLCL